MELISRKEYDEFLKVVKQSKKTDAAKSFYGTKDYCDFCKAFGMGQDEKYLALKDMKEDTNLSWEEMKNIRYGQIDLEKGTIQVPYN